MNYGTSPNTPWWDRALTAGALFWIIRELDANADRNSIRLDQNQSSQPDQSPPWVKLAVGGLIGYAVWKFAPTVLEYLNTIPLPPNPSPPVTNPPPPQIPITPTIPTHPGRSNGQFNVAAEGADSNAGPPTASWTPPPDARWIGVAPHPSIIVILGMRGSGKSALGYRLLELYRDSVVPYVVGLPPDAAKLLPKWVGVVDKLEEVPPGAAVLVDEAYLYLHARNSMSEAGRSISAIVNLSRQRGQTLIFIAQKARQMDVNVVSQADVVAIKRISEVSREFERRELRSFTDKARAEFKAISGDHRQWTWVYSEKADFSGTIENRLASFWRPGLSRAFADIVPEVKSEDHSKGNTTLHRKGTQTLREEIAAKAKALISEGDSYGQIAKTLGIPKSTVWDLVNEPNT